MLILTTLCLIACHSGSALDLPYIYDTSGKIKEPNLFKDAGQGALGAVMSYARGDLGGVFSSVMGVGKKIMNSNSGAAQKSKEKNTSPADVISWSGCKDIQTSADAVEAGKATGAMSWAFITALTKYPQQSYIQVCFTLSSTWQICLRMLTTCSTFDLLFSAAKHRP